MARPRPTPAKRRRPPLRSQRKERPRNALMGDGTSATKTLVKGQKNHLTTQDFAEFYRRRLGADHSITRNSRLLELRARCHHRTSTGDAGGGFRQFVERLHHRR